MKKKSEKKKHIENQNKTASAAISLFTKNIFSRKKDREPNQITLSSEEHFDCLL